MNSAEKGTKSNHYFKLIKSKEEELVQKTSIDHYACVVYVTSCQPERSRLSIDITIGKQAGKKE
jgi:hypothetical protein